MNARSVRNNGVLHALTRIRPLAGAFTMAAALALTFTVSSTTAYAQQTAGAVYGKASAGSTITAESLDTGVTRTATAGSDGSYRIGSLPPGNYKVTFADGTSKEVSVAIGSSTLVGSGSEVLELEKFVVGGLSVNPIDFGNMESVTVFNEKTVDLLPIARNTAALALLAPGTTQGDTAFGNMISFGGASVAENSYYVNGFNLSNFRNGLAPANVPFELYNQFEIKNGGYSAEFGRSTGGVINATTKSGTNEYKAGANIYFEPNAGRSKAKSSYYKDASGATVPLVFNDADYLQEWQANIYASGPLWKDKLFFFGLHQWHDYKRIDAVSSGTRLATDTADAPFWAVKLDFFPVSDHHFEFTAFTDEETLTTQEVDYDYTTRTNLGTKPTTIWDNRGGDTLIARYTGTFFEKLTISALWGNSTQNRTVVSSEDLKDVIYDGRGGVLNYIQGNPDILYDDNSSDERTAKRLDAEYSFELFGTHRLRAGFDIEDNRSDALSKYSGGGYLRYYDIPGNGRINGADVPAGATAAVRKRVYSNEGSFQVKSEAWYIEDSWSLMNDRLNLRVGLRNETFENLDALGDTFIKVTGQKAPRISATYDLTGDKKTKIFANFGRYHLPVASNTNIRLAGGEFFTEEYYVLSSVDADGTNPVLGAKIGGTNVYSNGDIHDRREIVDMDIKPMYQDEYILGFQHGLNKDFSVGARFTHRAINGTAMDDIIVDHALVGWANDNGFSGFSYDDFGAHAYVLANPGRPIRMFWDFNGNGTLDSNEEAVLSPERLGYPSASRNYYAVELFAEKIWDGKWNASFSYTWAQAYGNYEGWVLSDNGQDDAGLTQLFDSPALAQNTRGYTPNDRRHQFKAFGAYALTSEFTIGANISLRSGRPINKIGTNPNDEVASGYGASYLLVPRGSAGTTDWVFNTDLSLIYRPKWGKDRLTFGLDVFNVLNGSAVTEVVETFENSAGGTDYTYGVASSWQRPRYFRLSANFEY